MKEFIENLIGRLEEIHQSQIEKYTEYLCEEPLVCIYDRTDIENTKVKTTYEIIQIVSQLAEEHKQEVCEWKQVLGNTYIAPTCIEGKYFEYTDMQFCPYCGKRIKIVEPKAE